jgi:ABC-2 type transport system permease protein
MLVLYVLIIAGVFVTAFNLVDERESRTLEAILVTPVRFVEVLSAKGALGFLLAIFLAFVTLFLNGALGSSYAALLVALTVGALMSTEFGLIFAAASKDVKTLYTLMKTLNILLFAPVFFYIFPDWPQWIAKLFPTYWFLDPVFEITLEGATLADVWTSLVIALVLCAALLPVIALLARRMERSIALR